MRPNTVLITLVFAFIVILSSTKGVAQSILEIDTVTRAIKGEIPFDQDFIIKLKDPNQAIDSALVFELFMKRGELDDTLKRRLLKPRPGKLLKKVEVKHVGKFSYIPISALRPDLHFEVILEHKFRGDELQGMMKVIHDFSISGDNGMASMHALSEKIEPPISEGARTAMGKYWLYTAYTRDNTARIPRNLSLADAEQYSDSLADLEYQDAVANYFTSQLLPIYYSLNANPYGTILSIVEADLSTATAQLLSRGEKFEGLATIWRAIETGRTDEISNGLRSLTDIDSRTQNYELNKRISNLKLSKTTIENTIAKVYLLTLADQANAAIYDNMILQLQSAKAQLERNISFIAGQLESISETLDAEPNMRYTTWYNGTNEVRSLETMGSYLIIPNIGLTGIFTPGANFYKPMVGVSFHLRQVNKNIPLRQLKNRLLHRLAIQVGLTITELKDEQEEYFDLTNNMSVMLGINYKVTHAFGFSTGGVLMKRADPNPTILEKQTVMNYYFALTLDVDFAKALKSLSGRFGI